MLAGGRGDVEQRSGFTQRVGFCELKLDVAAGDAPLELFRRALGNDATVVEHRDPIGELVGLV